MDGNGRCASTKTFLVMQTGKEENMKHGGNRALFNKWVGWPAAAMHTKELYEQKSLILKTKGGF